MKRTYKILIAVTAAVLLLVMMNTSVTIKQGVNYKVGLVRMPLYLKVLDFFDRHFNYKNLVTKIVKAGDSDSERALKILEWVAANIKRVPEGMPVMDDHVWYTIVRGYGVNDQFSDVFTTLCNYAGLKAFYDDVPGKDGAGSIYLSFVKIDNVWTAIDPYNSVYFEDRFGKLAGIDALKKGDYIKRSLGKDTAAGPDYKKYFGNLKDIKNVKLTRSSIQSPLNRFVFEIRKQLNLEKR